MILLIAIAFGSFGLGMLVMGLCSMASRCAEIERAEAERRRAQYSAEVWKQRFREFVPTERDAI